MTDRVPGQHQHYSLEILADAAEGLLSPDQQRQVADAVEACAECAQRARDLAEASAALRDVPPVVMPTAILERLTELVQEESRRRDSGMADADEAAGIAEAAKRTDLGSFRQNPLVGKAMPESGDLVGRHQSHRH